MTPEQIKYLGQLLAALREARRYIEAYSTDQSDRRAVLEKIDNVINRKEKQNALY